MLRCFIGFDARQALTYSVCRFSIERRSSKPVAITPLVIEQMPCQRAGLTAFSWSRFLVPHLCDYQGWALFLDADMLCLGDISELFQYADPSKAVLVSKNKHRFEWASAILFNCEHPSNMILTPEYIQTAKALHGMQWLKPEEVGEFPGEWNFLAGYDDYGPAKIVHYTQGIPIFPETEGTPYTQEWLDEHKAMNSVKPWTEIMGNSVHAAQTKSGRLVARLHRDAYKAQPLGV